VRLCVRLGALAAAVLALAACGRAEEPREPVAAPEPAPTRTSTVERTTRVEVVKRLDADGRPAGRDGFDPAGIYEREAPGIVTVLSTGLPGRAGGAGLGSGFVVSAEGEVATNAHVVTSGEGRAIKRARRVYVKFSDGNQVPAQVRGFDPFADVALLRVDPDGLKLRPLPLGSTKDLVVGAPVAAIGSPFGEEQSLSVGVISATGRSIQSLTGFATSGAIQTDAAINQGNSGGPLLAADGTVLGINSQIRTESGDGTGVGFAVGVDTVKRSLDQLRATGRARYAYLGISSSGLFPQLVEEFDLGTQRGSWVQTVTEGGPADRAGIRAGDERKVFQDRPYETGGDVIVAVDGKAIRQEDDLSVALADKRPGELAQITVVRDGGRRVLAVKLGERPLQAPPRP
jgi:S1-C subfamily serine protease